MSTGCVGCHNGVNLGGQGYYPFGLIEKPGRGRAAARRPRPFPGDQHRERRLRVPRVPLRNIAITQPYFHSGKVWSLENAVALMGLSQLGQELNEQEVDRITAFLRSVTGDQPRVEYPVLPPSTDDTPRPVEYEEGPSKR